MKVINRFLARIFDYSLCFSITYLIGAKLDILNTKVLIALLAPLTPLIWIPFETLFLKLFKTTPGKALFGLKVNSSNYFKRSLRVWAQVVGCGLPPFCFICPFLALMQKSKKELSFDQDIESENITWRASVLGSILIASFTLSPFAWDHFHRGSAVPHYLDPQLYKSWTAFNASDKTFSAYFPLKVETIESQLPVPDDIKFLELTEHTAKHENHGTFSLAYTELPKKWLKYSDKLIIKHSMLHMADSMENTDLVKRNFAMHGNIPCIDYTLKSDGNDILGRMLLIGNRLYKIELKCNGSSNDAAREQHALFINSFLPSS